MYENKLTVAGKVVKTHGYLGYLKVKFNDNIKELLETEALFIYQDDKPVPYFIEEISAMEGRFMLIKLEDLNSKEEAAKLLNAPFLIEDKAIVLQETPKAWQYIDYVLFDQHGKKIGKVADLLELPGNNLIEVQRDGKEVLIPFREEFILREEKAKKSLHYHVAEGLLDIYLEE